MKIHEKIHVVASGKTGFGLTDPCDCTVYLVEGEQGCVLIDSGCGIDSQRILEQIRLAGHESKEIKAILLTHGHGDHAGGANDLRIACDASVYALMETALFVTNGDEEALSIDVARAAGVYNADFRFSPCDVSAIEDRQVLSLEGMQITAYRSEGHCVGHCCYLIQIGEEIVLFSGDSIFAGGKISLQAIWDCNIQAYIKTCRMLNELKPDLLLSSHGAIQLNQGYCSLEKAVSCLDKLVIPDNYL